MRRSHWIIIAGLGLALAGPALPAAATQTYKTLDPNSLQSFVGNWSPDSKPLCAVLQSSADWDKVLHPAPVMGGSKPFSPANFDWNKDGILLIARVIGTGDTSQVFHLSGVKSTAKGLEADYVFKPTPPASSTMKWYLAVVVPKPVAGSVRFVENGKMVCSLSPTHGHWVSPKLP